jgi:predicted DNA-binding transcriptional regulator AlpA
MFDSTPPQEHVLLNSDLSKVQPVKNRSSDTEKKKRTRGKFATHDVNELLKLAYWDVYQVAFYLTLCPATVWKRVGLGELPKPEKFGKRTTRWHVPTLLAFLKGKATN